MHSMMSKGFEIGIYMTTGNKTERSVLFLVVTHLV